MDSRDNVKGEGETMSVFFPEGGVNEMAPFDFLRLPIEIQEYSLHHMSPRQIQAWCIAIGTSSDQRLVNLYKRTCINHKFWIQKFMNHRPDDFQTDMRSFVSDTKNAHLLIFGINGAKIREKINNEEKKELLVYWRQQYTKAFNSASSKFVHNVEYNKYELIVRDLNNGVDPDSRHKGDIPALIAATKNNNIAIVKKLIDFKANINIKDSHHRLYGTTALHIAAEFGYDRIIELLGKKEQLDPNIFDDEWNTPLLTAIGSYDSRLLAAKGKQDSKTIKKSIGNTVLNLLHIPDIDVNIRTERGMRALMLAASKDLHEAVRNMLRSRNIDANARSDHDGSDYTALMYAVENNALESVKALLESQDENGIFKVDIDIQNARGETALDLAQRYDDYDNDILDLFETIRGVGDSSPWDNLARRKGVGNKQPVQKKQMENTLLF